MRFIRIIDYIKFKELILKPLEKLSQNSDNEKFIFEILNVLTDIICNNVSHKFKKS